MTQLEYKIDVDAANDYDPLVTAFPEYVYAKAIRGKAVCLGRTIAVEELQGLKIGDRVGYATEEIQDRNWGTVRYFFNSSNSYGVCVQVETLGFMPIETVYKVV